MNISEIRHQAFLQVVGEMWRELHKLKGSHRRIALELEDLDGSVVIRGKIGYFDDEDPVHPDWIHTIVGLAVPFSAIPGCMDTTMIFRELEDRQRKILSNL